MDDLVMSQHLSVDYIYLLKISSRYFNYEDSLRTHSFAFQKYGNLYNKNV